MLYTERLRIYQFFDVVGFLFCLAELSKSDNIPVNLGCYNDKYSTAMPHQPWNDSNTMDIRRCLNTCRRADFTFAGLKNGRTCNCGSFFPNQGPAENPCNMPCSKNPAEICGGNNVLNVFTVCSNGTYKSDTYYCDNKCGNCKDGVHCNHINGTCENGCKVGWSPPMCQVCTNGFYGVNCDKCGHCKNPNCDITTGRCDTDGCFPGWQGPICLQECSEGFFGNCTQPCGHCEVTTCNKSNGFCSICVAGWQGDYCRKECDNTTYGPNCQFNCGNCENTCNKTNGYCHEGCLPGWQMDLCQIKITDGGTVVGPIVGSLVVALVIGGLVIAFFIIYKRKTTPMREAILSPDENNSEIEMVIGDGALNGAMGSNNQEELDPDGYLNPTQETGIGHVSANNTPVPSTSGHCNDEVLYNRIHEHVGHPIAKSKIQDDITKKDTINENGAKKGFEIEFKTIDLKTGAPCEVAKDAKNKGKNRYKGIIPYDHNRVQLKETDSDYINASYINGWETPNKFIATQGPKETCEDFWKMIWQHKVSTIVMVTNLKESSKEKCKQYWPDTGESLTYEKICVQNEQEIQESGFIKRTLHLKIDLANVDDKEDDGEIYLSFKGDGIYTELDQSERTVYQYHYTEWSQSGDLIHKTNFVEFLRVIRAERFDHPVVVHCSAGIGRTGMYIALDFLLDQAEREDKVDVCACVKLLRKQRVHMIPNVEQYRLIYEILCEALTEHYIDMNKPSHKEALGL